MSEDNERMKLSFKKAGQSPSPEEVYTKHLEAMGVRATIKPSEKYNAMSPKGYILSLNHLCTIINEEESILSAHGRTPEKTWKALGKKLQQAERDNSRIKVTPIHPNGEKGEPEFFEYDGGIPTLIKRLSFNDLSEVMPNSEISSGQSYSSHDPHGHRLN